MFDPSQHLMNIGTDKKPRWYLEVKHRLHWFREACPEGTIETEMLFIDLDRDVQAEVKEWDENLGRSVKVIKHAKGIVIFKATVTDGRGGKSTGTKMENAAAFGDFLEKAETGAIGRGLAGLGYGTQFTGDELDEGDRIVDAPIERKAPTYDPDKPYTEQQLQTINRLQRELGMPELASADGLSFGDCAAMLQDLSKRLQQTKRQKAS